MLLDKRYKITQASGESRRFFMDGAQFDPKAKTLTATDGRILARIPVETQEGDPTEPINLPSEAFKVLGASTQGGSYARIVIGKECITSYPHKSDKSKGKLCALAEEGEFPLSEPILKQIEGKAEFTIALNAHLLSSLAKALGSATGEIKLSILSTQDYEGGKSPDGSPFRVEAFDTKGDGAIGVLMPCTLKE